MMWYQSIPRSAQRKYGAGKKIAFFLAHQQRCFGRTSRSPAAASKISSRRTKLLFTAAIGGACMYNLGYPRSIQAEAVPLQAEIGFELTGKKGTPKEENRQLLGSQHLQGRAISESPGVYAWGSNSGRVIAPDSDEAVIKIPQRIPFFDGKLIRDIKLDSNFGAAIAHNGDLLQWGTGFSQECREPTPTLVGRDLVKISISRDRIIALSSNGTVYSISASQEDQISGPKPRESSWFPFWPKFSSSISYRTLDPSNLSWTEKVSDINSGQEHCLILTSSGRLFSAVSGTEDYPTKGQLGIPGLTWATRPQGRYDQPHEITTLKGFNIKKIATGDYHSLALDSQGRIFSFGDNSLGQLGFDFDSESSYIDAPCLLPIEKLYKDATLLPRITGIAAGGMNSFFIIEATRIASGHRYEKVVPRDLGRVTADVWSCGQGLWGGLGNGKWKHVQYLPTKIPALSGLSEFDERKNSVVPIRIADLSVGASHAAAVMDNVTHTRAAKSSSPNDMDFGADVLWWGNNEFFQLGTRKRSNIAAPTYIAPLDVNLDNLSSRKEEQRLQIIPRREVKVGGRWVSVEQRVECGRGISAVYLGT